MPDASWRDRTTQPGDRAVIRTDLGMLWELRKDEHVAQAAVRRVGDYGDELVYRYDGDVRETRLFRDGQGGKLQLEAAAKRAELQALDWRRTVHVRRRGIRRALRSVCRAD
jgi:hypothetical protein